jgi:hypothetical protein
MARFFLTTIPKSGTHILVNFFKIYGIPHYSIDDKYYRKLCIIENSYNVDELFIERYGHCIPLFEELGINNKTFFLQQVAYYRDKAIADILAAPDNTYMYNHYPYDPCLIDSLVTNAIPAIILVRDPRDFIISFKNHIIRHSEHNYHSHIFPLISDEERLLTLIHGLTERGLLYKVTPLALTYHRFHGWIQDKRVLRIRFEEIIGPKGNGTRFLQFKTFERIMTHIGLKPDDDRFYNCVSESFSPSHSMFFKGLIGQWKEEFTPAVHECFNLHGKYLLSEFGYSERGFDNSLEINMDDPSDLQRLKQCYKDAEREGDNRLLLIKKHKKETLKWKDLFHQVQKDGNKRLEMIKELQLQLKSLKSEYTNNAAHLLLKKNSLALLLKNRDEEIGQLKEAYRLNQEDSESRLELLKNFQHQLDLEKLEYQNIASQFALEKESLLLLLKNRDEEIKQLKELHLHSLEDGSNRLELIKKLERLLESK